MRVATAQSLDPDATAAGEELIQSIRDQTVGSTVRALVIYACRECDHALLLCSLSAAFPDVPLIGCTTDGEATGELAFREDSVVVCVFHGDGISVCAGVARDLSKGVDGAVLEALAACGGVGDATLCIALPESLTVSGGAIVRALSSGLGPDVCLVGGTAGDQWRFEQTRQFFGTEVLSDACPFLLLSGDFTFGIGVASGWRPLGQRARVTSAVGNVIHTIDDKPALEFFRRVHGPQVRPDPQYPIGVWVEGAAMYLRAPLSYAEDTGHVTFAGEVDDGATVQLTEGTRDDILAACGKAVEDAVQALGAEPDALLFFSCSARKQVLGTRTSLEVEELKARVGEVPMAGFYTYGEIAPNAGQALPHMENETFVTLALKSQYTARDA